MVPYNTMLGCNQALLNIMENLILNVKVLQGTYFRLLRCELDLSHTIWLALCRGEVGSNSQFWGSRVKNANICYSSFTMNIGMANGVAQWIHSTEMCSIGSKTSNSLPYSARSFLSVDSRKSCAYVTNRNTFSLTNTEVWGVQCYDLKTVKSLLLRRSVWAK